MVPEPTAQTTICRVCACSDERACSGGCWWVAPGLCSRCATPEQLEQASVAALARLWQDEGLVSLVVPTAACYLLIQALQLTVTYPSIGPVMRDEFVALGRHLQGVFDGNGPVADIIERGWDRDQDVVVPGASGIATLDRSIPGGG